jgi:uncharacterized membrane protein YgdD (TMEM256/DUF423 family)
MTGDVWIRIGAISGGLAVAMGAFCAHVLRNRVDAKLMEPRLLEVFEKGAQYQMYHSLALLAVGLVGLGMKPSGPALSVAGWSFLAGIVLFSGSLYALALTGIRWLGAITPLGGLAFLAGWAALAWTVGQARLGTQ